MRSSPLEILIGVLSSSSTKKVTDSIPLSGLSSRLKSNLYFGLGKAYGDINDSKKSFINYQNGNKILNKLNRFNIKDEINKFTKIQVFFSNENKKNPPQNSRKLIFIVGMPRSGTSLVEQILSSHEQVYGGGELPFLPNIINNKFFNNYENISQNKMKDIDPFFSDSLEEYIKKISLLDNSERVFTDKSPLNFKYIGFIKKIFQNSRIINCRRDASDVAWSNYKNFFPASLPFSNSLVDLANYYNLYEDYMKYWQKKFEKDVYNIQYEELVNDPRIEIEKLLQYCDLNWDENCMSHDKNSRSIKTASATQARQPIYKSAIKSSNIFKNYMDDFLKQIKN